MNKNIKTARFVASRREGRFIIREKKENGGILYRQAWISRIKNNIVRRFFILITLPVLFLINCELAVLALIVGAWNSLYIHNIKLFEMSAKRWKSSLEE